MPNLLRQYCSCQKSFPSWPVTSNKISAKSLYRKIVFALPSTQLNLSVIFKKHRKQYGGSVKGVVKLGSSRLFQRQGNLFRGAWPSLGCQTELCLLPPRSISKYTQTLPISFIVIAFLLLLLFTPIRLRDI